MNEFELKNMIEKNISKLKPGLTLLQKEQYITNHFGNKCFIDLYAKDEHNRHVLIELKKNNTSARQAIHEVVKYVEAVKHQFAAKDDEIHVIIASTEWEELYNSFYRFAADASFSVEGIKINVLNNEDFSTENIPNIPCVQGRFLAPWHNVYWYEDEIALENGIKQISDCYSKKGIKDYMIITFYYDDQLNAQERKDMARKSIAKQIGVDEINIELPEVPINHYMAYVAIQSISQEDGLRMIRNDPKLFEEVVEKLPEIEEKELYECIERLKPIPKCSDREAGYPAKFSSYLQSDNFSLLEILRFGMFQKNTLLSDNTILLEIEGKDGSTGQVYKKKINSNEKIQVNKAKEDISNCLCHNIVWKNHILRMIDEIVEEFPNAKIDISIFNPCTGIFTIYYCLTRKNASTYIPEYHITVHNPEEVRMYYGGLEETGNALTFSEILDKYYNGDLNALLFLASWGGTDTRDSDIIEDLGLQYRSFRCDNYNEFYKLVEDKWRPCSPISIFSLFSTYCEHNKNLIGQIMKEISLRDNGNIFIL